MKCQNCGTENVNGAKFCEKCGGALAEVVVESNNNTQVNVAPNKPASGSKFSISDTFKTMLNSVIHPIKAYEKLEKDSLVNCGIYAGILLFLTAIFNVIVYLIFFATKDYFKYKLVKAGDIVKYGFSILGYLALFIVLAAFIYKVASLFLKKDIEFKKILVGVLVGLTTAIFAKYIITVFGLFLNGKFFVYLFGTINIFALLYSIFYTIKIVTKDFGSDDEKGILTNIICLTILFALSSYVLADWFTTLTGWFSAGIFTL